MPNLVPFVGPTLESAGRKIVWILGCADKNTWYQVAEISWLDLGDHWFFAD
jgi:hypothetical protein